MLRLHHLVAPFALACAVVAAPAAAQGPVTSLADQLQQQALHDALRAQPDAMLRSLALRRNGAAPEAAPAPLPPIRLAALEDSVVRYDRLHHQQRRWSHVLLTVGTAALVGGFANHLAGDVSSDDALSPDRKRGCRHVPILGMHTREVILERLLAHDERLALLHEFVESGVPVRGALRVGEQIR